MSKLIQARLQLRRDDFTLDVDLQLPGRGVSALFGHSGSGKTSCLRCLAGLEQASHAYIEVNGEVWEDSARGHFLAPHKRPVGYVFQEASLFPHLSVRGNLEFGWRRVAASERKISQEQACQLLGISHLLARKPATLSGGEAQRVKLARELAKRDTGKTLYILDEPTTGLHFEDIRQLLTVLHRLRDHGNTIVVIEHNLDVIKTADWIVDLGPEGGSGGGQIIAEGTPEQLAKQDVSHTGRFLAPLLARGKRATKR